MTGEAVALILEPRSPRPYGKIGAILAPRLGRLWPSLEDRLGDHWLGEKELFYDTVHVSRQGVVFFMEDIYGHDEVLDADPPLPWQVNARLDRDHHPLVEAPVVARILEAVNDRTGEVDGEHHRVTNLDTQIRGQSAPDDDFLLGD